MVFGNIEQRGDLYGFKAYALNIGPREYQPFSIHHPKTFGDSLLPSKIILLRMNKVHLAMMRAPFAAGLIGLDL